MSTAPSLSVVVPLHDEEENVPLLAEAVLSALGETRTWELVLVDDGSTDGTAQAATTLTGRDGRIRLVRLVRNYGQATAMQAGIDHSRGNVVVTMDGDLQNDPRDIPELVAKLEEGYDLVVGYRVGRQDRLFTRKVPSWAANKIIRWITGVKIRDNGCSLKAYRREVLDRLRLYSDMHRFIPAMAAGAAGARIAEVPVRHYPRRYGKSKYGLSRIAKVLADLLTITMIRWFGERPLIMFACGALVAIGLTLAFGAAAVISLTMFGPEKANALVLPGASLVWLGLACYLVMLGLIAEVALRGSQQDSHRPARIVREETVS